MISAVLVGINAYRQAPLRGCVNDILIMRDILRSKFKVPTTNIRLVTDQRATKSGILERLDWLVQTDSPVKLFYYSGHGAQVPIRDYRTNNEPDGMDEILCPYDLDWLKGVYITDDDFLEYLINLSDDSKVYVILDCCHSGGFNRGGISNNSHNPEVRIRSLETPPDLLARLGNFDVETAGLYNPESAFQDKVDKLFDFRVFEDTPRVKPKKFPENVALFMACREDQTAADAYMSGRYQGAFSYFFQGCMLKLPVVTVQQLVDFTSRMLLRSGFPQKPRLIASANLKNSKFLGR